MDERFLMHRLKSTSLAGVTGAVALGVWTLFQFYKNGIFRTDLFVIMSLMAVVKVISMLYLKRHN